MDQVPEASGISWLSHPQKIFAVKSTESKNCSKKEKKTNKVLKQNQNGQIKINEEKNFGEDDDRREEPEPKRANRLERVADEQYRLVQEKNEGVIPKASSKKEAKNTGGLQNKYEDVEGFVKSIDKKDHLLNKSQTNEEQHETMETTISEDSDISWLSHPQKIFAAKAEEGECSSTKENMQQKTNEVVKQNPNVQIKINEREDVREGDNRREEPDIKDQLINKIKANKELYVIMEKITKMVENTQGSGKTIKKILSGIITFMAKMNDEEIDFIAKVATKLKEMEGRSIIERTFLNHMPMEYENEIGSGGSSIIYSGYCFKDGIKQKVAIKKASFFNFEKNFREAMTLAIFNHKSIIKLIAVSTNKSAFAMEYMDLGSLSVVVQVEHFTDLDLLIVIRDISSGMEYLHSKDYIHRDLACRNVVVNSQKQCKICDFEYCVYVGYTNGIYFEENLNVMGALDSDNVPTDVCFTRHFSKASDVWAMGTLINNMYNCLSTSFTRSIPLLKFGNRIFELPKPARCPPNVWTFTKQKMLNQHVNQRTTFSVIRQKFHQMLEQGKNDL